MNDFFQKLISIDPICNLHFMKSRTVYENCKIVMKRQIMKYTKIIQIVDNILPHMAMLFDIRG